jgi:hypothetical protein
MRLARLAKLYAWKYKIAASPADLENDLRRKIIVLWTYPNKNFGILKACAESGAAKPQTPNERKAVAGYQFCKQLLSIIDYLKVNYLNISLPEIREVLTDLIQLINSNKDMKFSSDGAPSEDGEPSAVQFPHVSELIFQMVPISKKHDMKLRNEQFGKAKTGLARIMSVAIGMMDDIHELERVAPEKFQGYQPQTEVDIDQPMPGRFAPQRAPLSEYDIIDFIRQHGSEYGISSQEDWGTVFRDDPQLKQDMTTVINALNRGHYPKDSADVKMQIAEIIKNHEQRKSSNAPLFEDVE